MRSPVLLLTNALLVIGAISMAHAASNKVAEELTSTPPGITLQPLGGFGQGYRTGNGFSGFIPRVRIAYTDAKGMVLYTSDNDPPGKSVCIDDCTQTWRPAVAPSKARSMGDWTVITRADGTKQWALKGKPLYTYVKDVDVASVGGNSPAEEDQRHGKYNFYSLRQAEEKPVELPAGWNVAYYFPVPSDHLPAAFAIKVVDDAMGLSLVNSRGFSLYAFDGDINKDKQSCGNPCDWIPLVAPAAINGRGDFTTIARDNGIKQWLYRGKGLYTFARDLIPGDAHGSGVDSRWRLIYVTRDFSPPNVTIQVNSKLGKVLADAKGFTLYSRDQYLLQTGGGHNFRHGIPTRPVVGRDIGTNPRCNYDCEKEDWRPFLAPANALPQGSWDVYTRADGSKQWAYRGYALWTYAGDKKPGDILGHSTFQYFLSESTTEENIDTGTPYGGSGGTPALYWRVAIP